MTAADNTAPRYPLGEKESERIQARTGVPLDEITLEAVRDGRIQAGDLTISRETLQKQSTIAAQAGYRQLAANLARAAELVALPNDQVLRIYEALRPRRSSYDDLQVLSDELEREHGAAANAAFIRQAAAAYRVAGLLRIDLSDGDVVGDEEGAAYRAAGLSRIDDGDTSGTRR